MKTFLLLVAVVIVSALAGCANGARPVMVDNGAQNRLLVPCSNDNPCVRSGGYEVAKDAWCSKDCAAGDKCCTQDYPVSYRSKNWEHESDRFEYINKTRQQEEK